MWSRSGDVMLFQNIVAWVKWSSKDRGPARPPATDLGALHRAGHVHEARRRRRGTGTRRPASWGSTGATPSWMACWPKPSRWFVFTGDRGRLIGQLVEVGPAQAGQLGVEVGEVAGLQQRVVGEVDAPRDVGGAERHLLGLGEEVGGVAVEGQPPDEPHRGQLLGDDLGGVEQVDALEALVVVVGEELDAEVVLRAGAGFDGVPQVAAVEVGVDAAELLRLLPHQRVDAGHRLPVELDQRRRPRPR